jgi:hypothetical protein
MVRYVEEIIIYCTCNVSEEQVQKHSCWIMLGKTIRPEKTFSQTRPRSPAQKKRRFFLKQIALRPKMTCGYFAEFFSPLVVYNPLSAYFEVSGMDVRGGPAALVWRGSHPTKHGSWLAAPRCCNGQPAARPTRRSCNIIGHSPRFQQI